MRRMRNELRIVLCRRTEDWKHTTARETPISFSIASPSSSFPARSIHHGSPHGNVVSGASSPHLVIIIVVAVVVRTWLFAAEIYCLPHPSITEKSAQGLDEFPYMMSASEGEGGHGKADVVRKVE